MDRQADQALDQMLNQTSASVLKTLDGVVDVEQRMKELLRDVGIDPAAAESHVGREDEHE
jgi:hypothetical protein